VGRNRGPYHVHDPHVGNYDHEELILDARAKIFQQGLAPEGVAKYVEGLRASEGRGLNPEELLSKERVKTDSKADVLLFCGCETRESNTATVIAMGKLFNQAGVKFQVLPAEPCCGWPLYQLGDLEGAREFSTRTAGEIRASGASMVAVLDADCYRMLSTRTARFGGDLKGIKIIPVTDLLAEWIESGRIEITRMISDPATYHDPCVLARYCEDIDAPRKILASILDGELKEMDTNRKLANCCGAGGMLSVHRPDLSQEVALLRLEEARSSGASIMVTGCPRCDGHFARAMDSKGQDGLRVTNLVKLVAHATGLGE
jgi:Fe-S oxidoreductase